MRRLPRKRRILKWAGLLACAPLVLAIVLTQLWSFGWSGMQYSTELTNSAFLVTLYRFDIPFDGVGPSLQETGTVSFIWWYQSFVVQSGIAVYIVPLWMPLALIGIPTIRAWQRDRRGQKRCQEEI